MVFPFRWRLLVQNVTSAAVPLFNYNKDLLGTITLIGFLQFFPQDVNHEASQQLLAVQRKFQLFLVIKNLHYYRILKKVINHNMIDHFFYCT